MELLDVTAPSVRIFGLRIHAVRMQSALDIVDCAIKRRSRLQIGVLNAAKLVNMRRDPALRDDVMSSNLILADGIAVVWASRILGEPLPERVTGIDLMMGMLERGNRHQYSIYCLGAEPEVARKVVERIAEQFPKVVIAGSHHGYFSAAEEPELVRSITSAQPDILLVAMTSPKKEKFMAQWIEQLNVPVCHGVGGSFDVYAGKVVRAPVSWQRLGLEWLYRLKQEPRRLWRRYLTTNTLFCAMVATELWRNLTGSMHDKSPTNNAQG